MQANDIARILGDLPARTPPAVREHRGVKQGKVPKALLAHIRQERTR